METDLNTFKDFIFEKWMQYNTAKNKIKNIEIIDKQFTKNKSIYSFAARFEDEKFKKGIFYILHDFKTRRRKILCTTENMSELIEAIKNI